MHSPKPKGWRTFLKRSIYFSLITTNNRQECKINSNWLHASPLLLPVSLLTRQHTHTHPFNGPFSGTTRVSRYQKGRPIWILLKQETVSGNGIRWATCKSAPCSRQITMPAPPLSFFTGRMPFLSPNQQRQSTEGQSTRQQVKNNASGQKD